MYNKNNEKLIGRSDLYFSHIWSNGIYCWNEGSDFDPTDPTRSRRTPLFMDVATDELFCVKKVYWKQNLDEYKYAILHSPESNQVIWPVDLVELNHDVVTDVFIEPDYNVHLTKDDQEGDTNMVLLFPDREYGITKTVNDRLRELGGLKAKHSWRNSEVLDMAMRLVEGICKLNEAGYIYMDFDLDRMYLTNDNRMLFEYSHLIVRDKTYFPDAPDYVIDPGEYAMDFARPAVVNGRLTKPRMDIQNYSLTAVLFYLLVGRYPYDGPMMVGFPDSTPIEHMHKFEAYHKDPVFIFDPADTRNQLGEFAADQRYIDNWNELPGQLKTVFCESLKKELAIGTSADGWYTPQQWLQALQLLR